MVMLRIGLLEFHPICRSSWQSKENGVCLISDRGPSTVVVSSIGAERVISPSPIQFAGIFFGVFSFTNYF